MPISQQRLSGTGQLSRLGNYRCYQNTDRSAHSITPPQGRRVSEVCEEIKHRLHRQLIEKIDVKKLNELPPEVVRREVRHVIDILYQAERPLLNRMEQEGVIDEVLDEVLGLGPLEPLLKDPTVTDILVNGPH